VPIRPNRDFIPPFNPYLPIPNYRNPPGEWPYEWYWSETEHIWTDEESTVVTLIGLEFTAASLIPSPAAPYFGAIGKALSFSVHLDSAMDYFHSHDAIDDTGIIDTPDLFSVVEGFGWEDKRMAPYPARCEVYSRFQSPSGGAQCRLTKGHGGRHEF